MLLYMSKNEANVIDCTNIINALGTRSEITIDTSSSEGGIITSYHLVKRSAPNRFGVLAVNELPASGPDLIFTTKNNDGKITYRTGDRLFCRPLDVDSANFSLGILERLTVTRYKK
jgi:hypothetical protein